MDENRTAARGHRPPDSWTDDIEAVTTARFYLINRQGPLLFVLSEATGDKLYKIWIGSPHHRCSCGGGDQKNCIHINFVLIKILRLGPTNPLAWMRQLSDADINHILKSEHCKNCDDSRGHRKHNFLKKGASKARMDVKDLKPQTQQQMAPTIERKTLDEEDKCSICQEDMTEWELKDEQLCYCREGCGSNFHLRCFRVLQAYALTEKKTPSCPLCRALIEPMLPSKSSKPALVHREMPTMVGQLKYFSHLLLLTMLHY